MKPRPFLSKLRHSSKSFPAMVFCLVATLATAPAATLYWDGTDTSPDADGGAGTWIDDSGTTTNWDDAATGGANTPWTNANIDTAVFGGVAGTVAIDAAGVTAASLDITGAYIFAGTGAITTTGGIAKSGTGIMQFQNNNNITGNIVISGGDLQLASNGGTGSLNGGSFAGNIAIVSGSTFRDRSNNTVTMGGAISGAGNLHKDGSGTMTLTGANTYTGKTIIAANGAGGPTLSVSSLNSVNDPDGTGELEGTPSMVSSSLGAPTTVQNGTIQLGSGTNTRSCTLIYTGTGETTDRVMDIRFNSGASQTINNSGSGLLKFTSTCTVTPSSGSATAHLYLRGAGDGELEGGLGATPIPGRLRKSDAGTWTLGGTNIADQVIVESSGALIVNGTLTADNATTPSISVNATSTLGGSGTVTGNVTVAAGANLSPGASAGTLDIVGDLDISALAGDAGLLDFELGANNALSSDRIAVTGVLNIGTDLLGLSDFNLSDLGGLENGTYTLISSGAAVSGTLDGTDLNGTLGLATIDLQISGGGTGIELVVSGLAGGGDNYSTWATDNGIGGEAFEDDFNNDGISNGVAYALGLSPTVSSQPPGVFSGNTITFTKGADAIANDDVFWIIETSTTLEAGSWTAEVTQPNTNNDPTIAYTFTPGTPAKKFARLKVVQVP